MRIGFIALVLCFLPIGIAVVFYSIEGIIYNPIFRVPAWVLNNVVGKTLIPTSLVEFTRLYNIPDYYNIGNIIMGVMHLAIASVLTMYFIYIFSVYICRWMNHYCLVYKLGAEGTKVYYKEQRKKLHRKTESDKALSVLESAQHEHYVQWKKFYKSDLNYKEWKKKVLNTKIEG
jgi:hypothetical protein